MTTTSLDVSDLVKEAPPPANGILSRTPDSNDRLKVVVFGVCQGEVLCEPGYISQAAAAGCTGFPFLKEANLRHYSEVFGNGSPDYAIPKGAQSDPEKLRQLSAFFFWTSWAASTNRPEANLTCTSNWPHEPVAGLKTGHSIGKGAEANAPPTGREPAP